MYTAFRRPVQQTFVYVPRWVTVQLRYLRTSWVLRNKNEDGDEAMQNFEALFKTAKTPSMMSNKQLKAAAWTKEDFGFGDSFGNYDKKLMKKSAKKQTKRHNKLGQQQGNVQNTRIPKYTEAPKKKTEVNFSESIEALEPAKPSEPIESSEHNDIPTHTPIEDLRTEFSQQSASYAEEAREFSQQALVRERALKFPATSKPMRREFSRRLGREKVPRKHAKPGSKMVEWRVKFQKMATEGLMFDINGRSIPVPEAEEPRLDGKEEEKQGEQDEAGIEEINEAADEMSVDNFDEGTFDDPARRPKKDLVRIHDIKLRRPDQRVAVMKEDIDGAVMLGQPAQTIVVRNTSPPVEVSYPTVEVPAEIPSIEEVIHGLETKNLSPEDTEMIANIDELRPDINMLSWDQFQKLKDKLSRSVTVPNLHIYLDHYDTQRALRPYLHNREKENMCYSWIRGDIVWEPQYMIPRDQHITQKDILLLNVLCRTWNLKIDEEEYGKGTMNIKVDINAISRLLAPGSKLLHHIETEYLSDNDSIRLNRHRGRLTIKAPYAISRTVLDVIDGYVTRMHTGNIPLSLFNNRRFTPQEIASLSHITNTWIYQTPEDSPHQYLNVVWVEEKEGPRGIESIKHIVTRLAYTAFVIKPDSIYRSMALPDGVSAEDIQWFLDASNPRKRGWWNRMGRWVRFSTPIPRKPETTTGQTPGNSRIPKPESTESEAIFHAELCRKDPKLSEQPMPTEFEAIVHTELSKQDPKPSGAPAPTESEAIVYDELSEQDPKTSGQFQLTDSKKIIHAETSEQDPKLSRPSGAPAPTDSEVIVHAELSEQDPKPSGVPAPTESEAIVHAELSEYDPKPSKRSEFSEAVTAEPTESKATVHIEISEKDPKPSGIPNPTDSEAIVHAELSEEDPKSSGTPEPAKSEAIVRADASNHHPQPQSQYELHVVEPELPIAYNNAFKWPLFAVHLDPEQLTSDWSPLATRTTAIFGHLLHPHPTDTKSSLYAPASPELENPTFLSPNLPHISSLVNMPVDPSAPVSTANTLILHFSASPHTIPSSHPEGLSPPQLELHISIPDDVDTITWLNTPKTLLAIHATHKSYIQLPASPVDVQITQHRLQTLAASSLLESEPLRAFIEASILDLSCGTLRTPPAVTLSIPKCPPDILSSTPILIDLSSSSSPIHEYQFLFMGLEMRESFATKFQSHRLAHTAIEAGFHGGQRDELSFDPVRDASGNMDEVAYLKTFNAMAMGAYFPWVKELKPMTGGKSADSYDPVAMIKEDIEQNEED